MKTKYIKITLEGGGSYVQPIEELENAIDGELNGIDVGDKATLTFEPVAMTDEEYENLPEFMGH